METVASLNPAHVRARRAGPALNMKISDFDASSDLPAAMPGSRRLGRSGALSAADQASVPARRLERQHPPPHGRHPLGAEGFQRARWQYYRQALEISPRWPNTTPPTCRRSSISPWSWATGRDARERRRFPRRAARLLAAADTLDRLVKTDPATSPGARTWGDAGTYRREC